MPNTFKPYPKKIAIPMTVGVFGGIAAIAIWGLFFNKSDYAESKARELADRMQAASNPMPDYAVKPEINTLLSSKNMLPANSANGVLLASSKSIGKAADYVTFFRQDGSPNQAAVNAIAAPYEYNRMPSSDYSKKAPLIGVASAANKGVSRE